MKHKLELMRDLEEIAFDAKQAYSIDYHDNIMILIEDLAELESFKYCDGCHKYHMKQDFREDYCEQCTVAGEHQRASDEQDYWSAKNDY